MCQPRFQEKTHAKERVSRGPEGQPAGAQIDSAATRDTELAAAAGPSEITVEASCLLEELFKLVDTDSSGTISASEFEAASGIIRRDSQAQLGLTFAELGGTANGEVNLSEWTTRMGTMLRPLGPVKCVDVCFQNLSRVRDHFDDAPRLHPWIDIDFSSLGGQRVIIDGAHRRGILLLQLRKLMRFIESHAGADGNLVSRAGADGTLASWWDRSPYNRGQPLNVYPSCFL